MLIVSIYRGVRKHVTPLWGSGTESAELAGKAEFQRRMADRMRKQIVLEKRDFEEAKEPKSDRGRSCSANPTWAGGSLP